MGRLGCEAVANGFSRTLCPAKRVVRSKVAAGLGRHGAEMLGDATGLFERLWWCQIVTRVVILVAGGFQN